MADRIYGLNTNPSGVRGFGQGSKGNKAAKDDYRNMQKKYAQWAKQAKKNKSAGGKGG